MNAGRSSLPEQSRAGETPAAAPGPIRAMRSPSTTTSVTVPPGKSASRKAHTGGYHSAGTPVAGPGRMKGGGAMAVASSARERDVVYPEERLPWPQTILLAVQHLLPTFAPPLLVPFLL